MRVQFWFLAVAACASPVAVGDLSTPEAACRAYESLPPEARTPEAFLAFWMKEDARILAEAELAVTGARAELDKLTALLAARLPEARVQAYQSGFRLHVGEDLYYFPLDGVSLAETYASGGPRLVELGEAQRLGHSAIVPMGLDQAAGTIRLMRVGGVWLRLLADRQRLLLMIQSAYLADMREWARGIRIDLDSGALVPETYQDRFQAYLGLYLMILERYRGG